MLREIYDPPVRLVAPGTRRVAASDCGNGLAATERPSGDLARAGLVIVSGMARAIDTTAHKSALAAQRDTIAVLACGVDVFYPAENRNLTAELASKGLILCEFAMGPTASPQNFSYQEPHYQWDRCRAARGGGGVVQRFSYYGAAGD